MQARDRTPVVEGKGCAGIIISESSAKLAAELQSYVATFACARCPIRVECSVDVSVLTYVGGSLNTAKFSVSADQRIVMTGPAGIGDRLATLARVICEKRVVLRSGSALG